MQEYEVCHNVTYGIALWYCGSELIYTDLGFQLEINLIYGMYRDDSVVLESR